MDYRESIKDCFANILEQEKLLVSMNFSMGLSMDIRPLAQTLDNLKIMMVYAWEKKGYGTYKEFFHGKELETKYLSILNYPHDVVINDFKKYLRLNHVRTMFDDDLKSLEQMEEIMNSL